MMNPNLARLASIGSPALGKEVTLSEINSRVEKEWLPDALSPLYLSKNGFFAFENALHVFPLSDLNSEITGYNLSHWNSPSLWKSHYPGLEESICFAEDLFGCQWMWDGKKIVKFDPETGATYEVATSLEEWAGIILSSYRVETGWPLAHAWQSQFRPLLTTERLLPKKLFVVGGEFHINNLYAIDAVEGMRFRADIARQIRDLPDGTKIQFKVK